MGSLEPTRSGPQAPHFARQTEVNPTWARGALLEIQPEAMAFQNPLGYSFKPLSKSTGIDVSN